MQSAVAVTAIPPGGWLPECALSRRAELVKLLGPFSQRTLRRKLEAYLRTGEPWSWDHDLLVGKRDQRIDSVMDALLRHHGVRPEAMVLLSLMHLVPEIRHGVGGSDTSMMVHDNDGPVVRGRAWIAPDLLWDATGKTSNIYARSLDLPQTLFAATIGRPLRSVISHPALDPLDLVIDGVSDDSNWPRMTLSGVEMLTLDPSMRRGKGDPTCTSP